MALQILLVEDSPGDLQLTREAFRELSISIELHVATDDGEAMAFLKRYEAHVDAPRPDMSLRDLPLPKMDGREVLAHIKEDIELNDIPTLILTTSDSETDLRKSYELDANRYLSKPVQLYAFEIVAKSISAFWWTKAWLPSRGPSE
jgi:chemotaxis family two-component system response regulator Rcp1